MKRRSFLASTLAVTATSLTSHMVWAGQGSSKVVIVGDPQVGKTNAVLAYETNAFVGNRAPTVADNYNAKMTLRGYRLNVGIWDTAGGNSYNRLRPLSYPGTDLFILAYSITSRSSFDDIRSKWLPEVRHHVPKANLMLAGLKTDLREPNNKNNHFPTISAAEGRAYARSLGIKNFRECSALSQDGLKAMFQSAIELGAGFAPAHTVNKRLKLKSRKKWPGK